MYVQDIRMTPPIQPPRPPSQTLSLHRPSQPLSVHRPPYTPSLIPARSHRPPRSACPIPGFQSPAQLHRHCALPIRRRRPRRIKQAPQSLHGRVQADGDSKDDKADIEEFGFTGLGACSEVEERGIDEAERDAEGSALLRPAEAS